MLDQNIFEIDLFFVREKVISGAASVDHIASENQITDILTKTMSTASFQFFRSKLNVVNLQNPP